MFYQFIFAVPPRTLQPTVAPIKQTNPWEQTPSPPQQPVTTSNPWATPTSSTTNTPTQARLTEAEKWLAQTSQTVSPVNSLGSPSSQQVQVQVHSGTTTPIQNGGLSNEQIQQQQLIYQQQQQQLALQQQQPSQQAMVASMNFTNANNAAKVGMVTQPQQMATQNGTGLGGTWTSDMSRTLPNTNANMTNGNGNAKNDNFEAKWAALEESGDQAPNPFKNAVKTFEINL